MAAAATTITAVATESANHEAFCARYDISISELENAVESPATTAYGAFLIDVGVQGDHSLLVLALAACLLGYGEVGLWLRKESLKPNTWVKTEGNPYKKWMDEYAGEWYQGAVRTGLRESTYSCAG
jgi:hydroxymethylpyrimidine/phosphomethylpyrimidine kinase